jgi:hypothetical protein
MAAYKWTQQDQIVRRESDGAFIPNDPGNTDWQEFQAWLNAGNVPDAPEPTWPAV